MLRCLSHGQRWCRKPWTTWQLQSSLASSATPISSAEFKEYMQTALIGLEEEMAQAGIPLPSSSASRETHWRSLANNIMSETELPPHMSPGDDDGMRTKGRRASGQLFASAMSGGCDSVCLTMLLKRWLEEEEVDAAQALVPIHVDHATRPEAGEEAGEAASMMQKLLQMGLPCPVRRLSWPEGEQLKQKKLRDARYAALSGECDSLGISFLFSAHHLDDQVETLMMRVNRSSSLLGLPGMRPANVLNRRLFLLRPLLSVPKERLRATCEAEGLPWIEDPTNSLDVYTRNVVRKYLGVTTDVSSSLPTAFSTSQLYGLVSACDRLRDDLLGTIDSALQRTVNIVWRFGYADVDVARLLASTSPHLHHYLVKKLSTLLSGRRSALTVGVKQCSAVVQALREAESGNGQEVNVTTANLTWRIMPGKESESPRALIHGTTPKRVRSQQEVPEGEWVQWGRWRVCWNVDESADTDEYDVSQVFVASIDGDLWAEVAAEEAMDKRATRRWPKHFQCRRALPAFLDGNGSLVAIPHLGVQRSDRILAAAQFSPI